MNLIKRFQAYAAAVAASHQRVREDMYPEDKPIKDEVFSEEFNWVLKFKCFSPISNYTRFFWTDCTPTGRWKIIKSNGSNSDLLLEVVYNHNKEVCREFIDSHQLDVVSKPNETINECACQ